jgi:CTP synthase
MEQKGMRIVGTSQDNLLVEMIELPAKKFYVGVQFHPEFKSRPNRPHPLFRDFVKAAIK